MTNLAPAVTVQQQSGPDSSRVKQQPLLGDSQAEQLLAKSATWLKHPPVMMTL